MKAIPVRTQVWAIVFAYIAIFLYTATLLFQRYLFETSHPDEVSAASGMYAFGDFMASAFIYCLLLIPTFFLLRILSHKEHFYTAYSKLLLVLSLTAPLSVAVLAAFHLPGFLYDSLLLRMMFSPALFGFLILNRLWARTKSPKRFTNYSILTEGGSFALAIFALFFVR